ncbi:MAG: HK97 family phage prohead protease [Plesiomonas sp.]|uniref:HK97 family phage prohead protease n=1 Tax=Plesiomonas sp. TaxID=2486279 RepID=UPI003F3E621F
MSDNVEVRSFPCEIRAEGDESTGIKIVGNAAVFNKRSANLGGFVEVIAPGAFDDVLNDDVRGLFNHERNFVLGRSKSGTLKLSIDDTGLRYEITPPDTQTVRDLVIEPMKRGDISESSFAFRIAPNGDRWDEDEQGVYVRTVLKVSRLYDVGPVTYPAYPDATAEATRSLQQWKESKENLPENQIKQQKSYRQRLLQTL